MRPCVASSKVSWVMYNEVLNGRMTTDELESKWGEAWMV